MLKYQYTSSEKKETIVLLHGFCENSEIFIHQRSALTPFFNVLCIDLPGFGLSSVIKNISITEMADEVKKLLAILKIKKCFLFGHSMGGYVALAFAKKYTEQLKGFGLIHSTAAKDSFERLTKRKQLLNFIKKNGKEIFFKTFFPELFYSKEKNNASINKLIEQAHKTSINGILEAIKAMMTREENYKLLASIPLPVFFVIGKHDTIIIDNDMFLQAAMCRQAEVCYLQQSNHMGMIEESDKLNEALICFVNRITNGKN